MRIQFPLFVPSDLSLTAKLNSNISKVDLSVILYYMHAFELEIAVFFTQ